MVIECPDASTRHHPVQRSNPGVVPFREAIREPEIAIRKYFIAVVRKCADERCVVLFELLGEPVLPLPKKEAGTVSAGSERESCGGAISKLRGLEVHFCGGKLFMPSLRIGPSGILPGLIEERQLCQSGRRN